MNNFDIKKFLVENKLTTISREASIPTSQPNIHTIVAFVHPTLGTEMFLLAKDKSGQVYYIDPDQSDVYNKIGEGGIPALHAVIGWGVKNELWKISEEGEPVVTSRGGTALIYNEYEVNLDKEIEAEIDNKYGIQWNGIMEIKSISENDLSTQQIASNEGSNSNMDKYLKIETAQAILSELDSEMALAELEIKKEQIQRIVQEIESKISTLEEDAGMKGFVDKAAINEKRRVVKELNRAYEQVNKLAEKMHAKRKKKMK